MVKIYADSTNDLTKDLIADNEITIIPLYVSLGDDKIGKDGIDIMPADIYAWAEENKSTPKTAAFSPGDAAEHIRACKEAGDDMIFIGLSEEMSATCNVVRLAAEDEEYEDHVFVVNSKNLSTGIGLILLRAVALKRQGLSASEICLQLEDIIDRVRSSFVVDTLTYLQRGGRCSAVTALLANTLKLKPKIVVKDGKMDVEEKYRGKTKQVVMHYVEALKDKLLDAENDVVFITHSGIDSEIVDEVRKYLASLNYFDNIFETVAGGVISSHCGPGTLGVLFISKVK